MHHEEDEHARVLFIGNSYTSRNRLPAVIAMLGDSASPPVRIECEGVFAGGASLRRHLNAGIAQARLAASKWDFVVLQEQSTLPLKNAARYHDNVRAFAGEIAAIDAPIVLYLTWSRQEAPQTQQAITEAVTAIARDVGARVAPVGIAWHAMLAQHPRIALYEADGSHPTLAGSYLAACVLFVTLFDRRSDGPSVAATLGLDRDTAAGIERVAREASEAQRIRR